MCKIPQRMWLLDESEVLPLLFQWWTGASPGCSFMEFPQWLSQITTWRSSPLDTLPFALDIRLSFVWSAPRLSLFHFPSRSMDFSCEARKGDVCGASLCAGVSEWLAANADSNNPPLDCFSGWELQSCLVPAIKFWTFAKLVQVLWTLASCRITGNWFLSSFRTLLKFSLFYSTFELFSVTESGWTLLAPALNVSLPSYQWINCWWRREDWECLL